MLLIGSSYDCTCRARRRVILTSGIAGQCVNIAAVKSVHSRLWQRKRTHSVDACNCLDWSRVQQSISELSNQLLSLTVKVHNFC